MKDSRLLIVLSVAVIIMIAGLSLAVNLIQLAIIALLYGLALYILYSIDWDQDLNYSVLSGIPYRINSVLLLVLAGMFILLGLLSTVVGLFLNPSSPYGLPFLLLGVFGVLSGLALVFRD
jgi:uncharacterized membrane protein YesL